MKYFLRAVLLSLRYKWSIIGAVVSSMLIAVLWTTSITAVFPIVKLVLEEKTAQTWVDEEIENAEDQCIEIEKSIEKLEKQITAAPAVEAGKLAIKLDLKRDRLNGEMAHIERFQGYKPWVDKYAPKSGFDTLVMTMVFLLLTSLLKGALLVLNAYLVSHAASATVMDLRRIYYRKALELDQQKIDKMGTSAVMTHLSHNMIMVSGGLRMFYGKCLREPLKMIVCLSVAAYISLPLLLLSLIVVPAGGWLIHSLSRRMKQSTEKEMSGMADVYQTLMETLKAIKTVRIFNRERTERHRFKKNSKMLYDMSMRISVYDSLLRPISEMLGIISISLSILAGAYLVLNRETMLFGIQISDRPIDPSTFVLFYTMLAGASDPARKMSEIVNVLVRGGTACENLYRTYDQAEPRIGRPDDFYVLPIHSQSILFRNISFAYAPNQPVLDSVDLEVPFGQTVAIVGGNGSGKSTLMNLLTRFYDPQNGQIFIDGVNIRKTHPKKLRQQISWVTQDSVLFRGTLWDNIAYGDLNASDEDVLDAAEVARIDHFVDNLEDGYQTDVGDDGSHLSAGQRQRVALARAVLANPRILILDEATSQMDGQTEGLVHEALLDFMKGRTTFIVTHRSSSLALADRVIVMEHGNVVHDSSVQNAYDESMKFQNLFERKSA